MTGPARVAAGLLINSAQPVRFSFDGRRMTGLAGDTLASALLANGVRLVARSFKYHRPRGIVTAGPEEPCALVDVIHDDGREPNRLATTLELHSGLCAESQNRWPSLAFDWRAVNEWAGRFLPAGFYYKTFMAPGWAWERVYEPLIRRSAGLGKLHAQRDVRPTAAETVHAHTDVLVIGAGAAGLGAALRLGTSGARVILVDQDVALGAGFLLDPRWATWRERACARLAALPNVRCFLRTVVVGAYGHGVLGAVETLTPAESAKFGGARERLHIIRAKQVVFATGAIERLIAFAGNDRPGVMLAGAALGYLRRYGVATGRRCAFFLNTDQAYEAVFALAAAGVDCVAVVDVRADSPAAARAHASGIDVYVDSVVTSASGRGAIRAITISKRSGHGRRVVKADCLLMSGGYSPLSSLPSQLGATLRWQESIAAFTPQLAPEHGKVVGAAHGVFGLGAALRDGAAAAHELCRQLGCRDGEDPAADSPERPEPPEAPIIALWEVPGPGKAFVDLQNDVTAADVRLAHQEGYEHVEHMKRYTTHGMATDQGRIGGLVGAAVLAHARGVHPAEAGQSKPRPFSQPVPFAALAGHEVGQHFKPKRRLPLHDWHEAAGASFVSSGLWLRPLVYSRQPGWGPVLEEARAVRRSVGMTDVSTLGKIDVQGRDAARFLDFVYANTFSTLAVGRARYGIMLREDGNLLDDGTTSRLGHEHFVVTTTTANSAAVLEHLEFHLQAVCPQLDVLLTDVSDQWAQFAIAGPRARDVVCAAVADLDLSSEAFPFMAVGEARIAEAAGRVFRISFSGELAYELAVPAREALHVWRTLLEAGQSFDLRPYGLDALNSLRIEKGHVTGAELNGNTNADDLGFHRMLKKQADYIGRTLAQRPGMTAADRLQLVGIRPVDRTLRLRNGSHLVAREARHTSLGYITSCTPGVELDGWAGLALLAGGRQRIGERLLSRSPLRDEVIDVEIVAPQMLDPENTRVRG